MSKPQPEVPTAAYVFTSILTALAVFATILAVISAVKLAHVEKNRRLEEKLAKANADLARAQEPLQ